MRINTNIMAMNAYRMYNIIGQNIAKSMERLSTGLRINRAADDPAGLCISEKMRAQIRGMRMASKNAQDAISLIQTAEGALQETHSILQRLRELAIQASSDTYENSIDRAAINAEYQALLAEINDTANKTTFNTMQLINGDYASKKDGFAAISSDVYARFFPGEIMPDGIYRLAITDDGMGNALFTITKPDGTTMTATADLSKGGYDKQNAIVLSFADGTTMGFKLERDATIKTVADAQNLIGDMTIDYARRGLTIQTGPNQGDEMRISIDAMNIKVLGIEGSSVSTRENASDAIGLLDRAINIVSTQRSMLGATQNRLEHKINNLENSILNLAEAESRIRDVDYAAEMSNLIRNQIQLQFATAILAQANSLPQMLLKLLE